MNTSSNQESRLIEFNIQEIMDLIPHRYPFLLIDKVIDVNPGESAIGIKNVTINEPFFKGHFPGEPIMPGVLIVEAMAQTAGVTVMADKINCKNTPHVYFMTIESARFRKPVHPGDVISLYVNKVRSKGAVWKFRGKAMVSDMLKAEAVFSAMIVENP